MKQSSISTKILPVLFAIWAVDLIFFGSGRFLSIFGVQLRKITFSLFCLFTIFDAVFARRRYSPRVLLTITLLLLFFGVWVIVIPVVADGDVRYAVSDAMPLMSVVVYLILPKDFLLFGWPRIRPLILGLILSVAVVHIMIFVLALLDISAAERIGDLLKLWMEAQSGGRATSVFLVPQPSGILRVYFGMSNLMFLGLYAGLKRTDRERWMTGLACILIVALAFMTTLTRSLVMGCITSIIVYVLTRNYFCRPRKVTFSRMFLAVGVPVLCSFFLSFTIIYDIAARFDIGRITSDEIRGPELLGLALKFLDSPVVGGGFGATSFFVPDPTAPYSYDFTMVALAMKLGVLGFTLAIMIAAAVLTAFKERTLSSKVRPIYAVFAGYLVSCFYNPYIMSSFGTFFLLILLFEYAGTMRGECRKCRRTLQPVAVPAAT